MKDISILPQPVEYVLPGPRGPRHMRQGLVCFRISLQGSRTLPTIILPKVPVVQVLQPASFIIDSPTGAVPELMQKLSTLNWGHFKVRHPTRSIGSTEFFPRTSLEVLVPSSLSSLALELMTRELRRKALSPSMYVGMKELYTAGDALILECLDASVMARAWPLCKEAIFLAQDKVLIRTEASTDAWVQLMDTLCCEGELNVITKIRWKTSRFGGRPWAVPTATSSALAASRRRRGKHGKGDQILDYVTDICVNGEVGMNDKEIMDTLVKHACTQIGMDLKERAGHGNSPIGTWMHLASLDPTLPPGRARLFLRSQEEVHKIYTALHGQVLQVGADSLSITVHNDCTDSGCLTGNGRRAW